MATFTFTKADPSDPRDIGLEIEEASIALANAYHCLAEVVDYSGDDETRPWVRIELHADSADDDCEEAGNWYFGELSNRGIVMLR
jgi:hypothetical protein